MMNDNADLYIGREQTLVKHFILSKYLERFAHIVGTFADAITYVDCFSGPWNVRSPELKDSSFALALAELRKARQTLAGIGRDVRLRCLFLERDRNAHAKLKDFADHVDDIEVETQNLDLEAAIPDILDFVGRGGNRSFSFVFIDPTGWKGFAMSAIAPLLRLQPGEVLINFMTGHIRRFIQSPDQPTQDSFIDLFGSADFRTHLVGLKEQDREDAVVEAYAENVKRVGDFRYVCNAIVLHPEIDRTHFHLIYATRNPKGVDVFKDVEKQAMAMMEILRADAQRRHRERKTRQRELFGSDVTHRSTRYATLRKRYLNKAKESVEGALAAKSGLLYDEAWERVVSVPLVWESDLKEWIRDWQTDGCLQIQGMQPRQRVPHRGKENYLQWLI